MSFLAFTRGLNAGDAMFIVEGTESYTAEVECSPSGFDCSVGWVADAIDATELLQRIGILNPTLNETYSHQIENPRVTIPSEGFDSYYTFYDKTEMVTLTYGGGICTSDLGHW